MAADRAESDPSTAGKTIVLIGYRGTGKTSVARALAARLRYVWADADDLVERRAGKTIAEIFAEFGEGDFRDREAAVVAELCRLPRTVVATGGGAVLREENRKGMMDCDAVVWLTAAPETIIQRLSNDPSTTLRRPNLTNQGGRNEIETLLFQRTPIYRGCATLTVDTENKDPVEIAEEIVARLDLAE